MAKHVQTSSTILGPSDTEENHDYVDLNNGTLYNIVASRKFDSFSVNFYTQHIYDQITKLLQASTTLNLMQMALQL